jgi:ArsR family transcriptional regulator
MPISTSELISTQSKTAVQFKLEQASILFNSLMMLNKGEENLGYNSWLAETAVSMTAEQRHTNLVITEGLHYAVSPHQSWPSFTAYIDYLAAVDPITLRDRLFEGYNSMECKIDNPLPFNYDRVMASADTFIDYLSERFPREYIDVPSETAAYHLLQEPAVMQTTIVNHLRNMWTTYLAAEWERVQPMLNACINAFEEMDLSNKSPLEIVELAIGKETPEHWDSLWQRLDEFDQIILIPSPHLGPYMRVFKEPRRLWLLFGARLPTGSTVNSPELSRSELLVRLNALADDSRLHILQLLHEEDELCSRDIMEQLNMSQSAASRHLKQLSATGYIVERRRDSAKCYRLNAERVEDTVQALSHFLLG